MSFHYIFFNLHPIQDIKATQSMGLLCGIEYEKASYEARYEK